MDCPHCGRPLTVVYRGLVVTRYDAHPVVNGRVDLQQADVPPHAGFEEEFEDGSHGVTYLCPLCRGDVSDLLDADGSPTGQPPPGG